jgi:hypothetical protein
MESLWIKGIEVQNFRSFRGSHTLEIEAPTSRAVYALLAKTGGGKTSLVNAVSWALRGQVISKEMTKKGMLRKVRPVIHSKLFEEMDEESRSKVGYPLLNIEAWRDRDLEMCVILRFVMQGDKEISVFRTATANEGGLTDDDVVHNFYVEEDGERKSSEESERWVTQYIPRQLDRYFLVHGDSVREFQSLIFGGDRSLETEVQHIVGLPQLQNTLPWIRRKELQYEDRVASAMAKKQKQEKKQKELEGFRILRKEAAEEVEGVGEEIRILENEERESQNRIAKHAQAEDLIKQRDDAEGAIERLQKEVKVEGKYFRLEAGKVWRKMLHYTISSNTDDAPTIADIERMRHEVQREQDDLQHISDLLSGEVDRCSVCHQNLKELSDSDRRETEKIAAIKERSIAVLKTNLRKAEGRAETAAKAIMIAEKYDESIILREGALEGKMWDLEWEMQNLQDIISKIGLLGADLDELDEEKERLSDIQMNKGQAKLLLGEAKDEFEKYDGLIKEIEEEMKRAGTFPDDSTADYRDAYAFIHKIWTDAIGEFTDLIRKTVHKRMNEVFLELIEDRENYSGLQLRPDWSVVHYDPKGLLKPVENDGHKQATAIAFVDALAYSSKIVFPMFFDNPGAATSKTMAKNFCKFYWSSPPGQMFVLSHDGGIDKGMALETPGEVGGVWEISYEEKTKSSTITKMR